MTRVLTFATTEEFALVHQGFVLGAAMSEKKSITDLRNIAKMLDKFDSISTPVMKEEKEDTYPTGDPVRTWNKEDPLKLTEAEHKLLVAYMEAVPWTTKVSREVVALLDKVQSCEIKTE